MIPDRRTYSLSKDQPIMEQARRRRKGAPRDRDVLEAEFWKNFNLEKLARGLGRTPARSSRAA